MEVKDSFRIVDEDWASDLQNGLEAYMYSLYEAVYDVPCGDEDAADDTESGIPFCGCNVCESREILSYVTPRLIRGYLEGKVELA